MPTLTYADGKYTIETDSLPAVTIHRMLQTATNHILGNEVSSQVVGAIRSAIAGKDGKVADVTTEQVKAFRERDANAAQITAWENEFRDAKVKSMLDGTLTVRATGSSAGRDPVETAMRAIAKMELTAVLRNAGAKFPGKDTTVTLADRAWTGEELIEQRLTKSVDKKTGELVGVRIRKEAERKVAADKRMKENAIKAAGESLADELGIAAE